MVGPSLQEGTDHLVPVLGDNLQERQPGNDPALRSPPLPCGTGLSRTRPPGLGRTGQCTTQASHHKPAYKQSFVPWDCVNFGCGRVQVFSQNDQLPKLLCALGGSPSQPIPSFPRLDGQASLVQHLPLHRFDFDGACACLPLVPRPIRYQKRVGSFFSIQLSC